jgi:hypothetical protein
MKYLRNETGGGREVSRDKRLSLTTQAAFDVEDGQSAPLPDDF